MTSKSGKMCCEVSTGRPGRCQQRASMATDRLAKAAARRAHAAAARSREQRAEQALDALADSIVAAIMAT